MKKLIAVNKQDKILGYESWQECHRLKGILHRGFTVLVVNNKGEILLQKRSQYKPLWSLFWDGTCSSHPRKGETYIQAAERRLKEEMGFTCKLKYLFKFQYKAKYKNKGSENEVCTVLLGKYNGKITPNKKEVADYRWVSLGQLKKEIKEKSEVFTPWFRKIIKNKNFAERNKFFAKT